MKWRRTPTEVKNSHYTLPLIKIVTIALLNITATISYHVRYTKALVLHLKFRLFALLFPTTISEFGSPTCCTISFRFHRVNIATH
ncbi:hypothetical protein PILCRDRAFT_822329 [Piloderma croceum F 1598]|uniref:Uncharacterized protein n=1 Tax=Piloderma croceum (strain F 1598) TaxID=765440 RepID=A0A0C3BTG9_PILCF|nr:hypothetical protein PILCRDRAFT_822329 [Piloderma croceum F 1598]